MELPSFFSLLGRASEPTKEYAPLESFLYSYDGTIGRNNYRYEVKNDQSGNFQLTYSSFQYQDYGEMVAPLDDSWMLKLKNLCQAYDVKRWDGFNKSNKEVSDGSGFSFFAKFSDGSSVSAYGMNSVPDGYREFESQLNLLFQPLVDSLLEKQRQLKVAQGVQGNCRSILATFIQQGQSGRDEYHLLIYKQGVRENNFDVKIKSCSGEFFEKGYYRYYAGLPDEALHWDKVTEIMERNKVVCWMNYDKAAPDANNSEWFQFAFGFEEGRVEAMGTLPPENYGQFRQEFLSWLCSVIKEAETKRGLTASK
ncbi:MAG: hypothetical protein J6Y37_01075 [Paludibacteraceae bacterium]|nr:hypothetical protein [Paludibacteraceae bacterium]